MIRGLQEIVSRLACVLRRKSVDHDFEEEFATHIELLTEENERRGLPRNEARRQAIIQLGGMNATREGVREARGLPRFERCLDALYSIVRDFAHAARSLANDRVFTLVCVISLGIGMGACVALATFIRGITAPGRGIDTNGLVEFLVLPLG